MAKRPSTAARNVAKPAPAAAAGGSSIVEAEEQASAPRGRPERNRADYQTRDFKTILARVNRDGWKELKRLSTDVDMTFQDIFIDALNDYLEAKGYSPVVESRVYPKD